MGVPSVVDECLHARFEFDAVHRRQASAGAGMMQTAVDWAGLVYECKPPLPRHPSPATILRITFILPVPDLSLILFRMLVSGTSGDKLQYRYA
jgi:hypothetical protein